MDTRTVPAYRPIPPQYLVDYTQRVKMYLLGALFIVAGFVCFYIGSRPTPPLPCVHVTSYTDYHGPNPICQ